MYEDCLCAWLKIEEREQTVWTHEVRGGLEGEQQQGWRQQLTAYATTPSWLI